MELIDKNALKETILRQHPRGEDILKIIEDDIENTPEIDAVPVVRCKDCKYMVLSSTTVDKKGKPLYICSGDGLDVWIKEDYFCCFGEKNDK